jgi:hypothetical protein
MAYRSVGLLACAAIARGVIRQLTIGSPRASRSMGASEG